MAHPEVEEAAGCRKSVLCSAYRDFVTRVGSVLRREYPQEDPESVLTLALLVVDKTGKLAVSWAESEKVFAGLFQINKNHETSRA